MSKRRGILYVGGVVMIGLPPAFWLASGFPSGPRGTVLAPVARTASESRAPEDLAALVQRDPMSLMHLGRQRYEREVREYRCVLIKQERLNGGLSEVQQIELRFREAPRSVYMLWQANADQARRALYMDDGRFVDDQGRKLARVEPAGAIARLFVKDLYLPIHGPEARKASRRAIDEAGFRATFDLLEGYNAAAAERGVLDLRYGGTGVVDGRPTFIIVRDLPYDGPSGPYPDARMILHLDQEWLLPVAVYSYADHQEKELLGSYVFTQVDLHPDFDGDDFEF
jgi:hypothetical protein